MKTCGRGVVLVASAWAALWPVAHAEEPDRTHPTSATVFLSPALRAEQDDDTRNRGLLWVERGDELWRTPAAGRSCASCHGDIAEMRGVAARYPAIDSENGTLQTLETRINACRTSHQGAPPLGLESDELLALTTAVAHRSRGLPVDVSVTGAARPHFERGRTFFFERQGQLNLSCAQCHDDRVGAKLRGDTISSGLTTGYPVYRLEWQGVGSVLRRLQACQLGVRATPLEPGGPDHLALELYLAWRGKGQTMETPALRR